jgi:drug/metabolite transporter (DMT)-like permease
MKILSKNLMIYSWIFLIAGFLTTAGSMLILSQGFLFNKYQMNEMHLPAVLLFVAGPFSLVSGFLLIDKFKRGVIFGLVTSGIFIFCSVSYFFQSLLNESNTSILKLSPGLVGILIAFGFIFRVMKLMRHIL